MNAKEFSVALGNVRNEYVAEAVTYRHINCNENIVKGAKEPTKKLVWIKWGTMAACLCLMLIGGLLISDWQDIDSGEVEIPSSQENEIMVETTYLNIYYLASNGAIESKGVEVRCTIEDIFNEWAVLNNILDVTVISCVYDDGGTESVQGDEDNSETFIASHSSGNYFTLNLTISAEFSTYVESEQGNLLIESLRKTLYDYIYFDEFNLMIAESN